MEDAADVEAFYDQFEERLGLTGDYEHLEPVLPDVSGKRVLDAGCGLGAGSQYLADSGATVVGVDLSNEHVEAARAEYGADVEFHRMDLTEPLDHFGDGSFDLVVCALVLAHVEDWDQPFAEFARLLGGSGSVVVHVHHPFVDYLELESDSADNVLGEAAEYAAVEQFGRPWGPDGAIMPMYRRPLGEYLRPALDAGFVLAEFLEPGTGPHDTERYDPDRPPRHLLARFDRCE